MIHVKDDAGNDKLNNGYTSSRQRLVSWQPGVTDLTWFVWGGSSVIAEYKSTTWGNDPLIWQKSYIYAGSRLLSTYTNNGAGGETQEFHHPDRLGTKLVTNNVANTSFEQATLPFGTALDAEAIGTNTTNQKFTSYDRSAVTGIDYAVNRSYSPAQGRFTSVDPIGMGATSIGNPQSMNLYAYVQNNPIDFIDPTGLDDEILFREEIRGDPWNDPGWRHFLRDSQEFMRMPHGDPGLGREPGGGGGGEPLTPPAEQPKPQKEPCAYQNFNASQGMAGLTATQASEVARTAVGEASTYYALDEVENVIAIMENMMTANVTQRNLPKKRDFDVRTFGKPNTGSINILDILGEFDAYKRDLTGDRKLESEKKKNGGVLSSDSYVCQQITEAMNYLAHPDVGFAGGATTSYGITQNRGAGKYNKNTGGLTYVFTIGDTRFYRLTEMYKPRPKK